MPVAYIPEKITMDVNVHFHFDKIVIEWPTESKITIEHLSDSGMTNEEVKLLVDRAKVTLKHLEEIKS